MWQTCVLTCDKEVVCNSSVLFACTASSYAHETCFKYKIKDILHLIHAILCLINFVVFLKIFVQLDDGDNVSILDHFASNYLMSLCRIITKPHCLQFKACGTSYFCPQRHWDGKPRNALLYRIPIASLNSPLLRVNSCSSSGITLSQLKAPFSLACCTARRAFLVRDCSTSFTFCSRSVFCSLYTFALISLITFSSGRFFPCFFS